eukprot:gene7981-10796_t
MPHSVSLINTIAAGLGLALVFGFLAAKLRLPALVGYLLAGVIIGPFTPGFVADAGIAAQLAEIGVMLLMFGVGLHFSLKDLLSVKAIAVPGAIVQIGTATLLGMGLGLLMGWGWVAGLVFGLALSVASTVVLLRALQERRLVQSEKGKIAVGWLIVEDLAMVLALVMIPAVADAVRGAQPGISSPLSGQFDLGLWYIISEQGGSAGVVGWMGSFPAEAIHGAFVADAFGHAPIPPAEAWPVTAGSASPAELAA